MKALIFFLFMVSSVGFCNREKYNSLVTCLGNSKVSGVALSQNFFAELEHYDLNFQEPRDGYSLLMVAAAQGFDDVVTAMLSKGANPNLAMHWGNTALHEAMEYGTLKAAQLLLASHANLDAKTKDNLSPIALGIVHGNTKVIATLKKESVEVARYLDTHATELALIAKRYDIDVSSIISDESR